METICNTSLHSKGTEGFLPLQIAFMYHFFNDLQFVVNQRKNYLSATQELILSEYINLICVTNLSSAITSQWIFHCKTSSTDHCLHALLTAWLELCAYHQLNLL